MRILLDDAHLGWDEAWEITKKTLAYTNHTLLPEALEKWPLRWFEIMLPRQLEIIYEINRRLLDDVQSCFRAMTAAFSASAWSRRAPEERSAWPISRLSDRTAPTAWRRFTPICCAGTTVKDLAEMFPERFNNKTNGVTPRRWLLLSNPALSQVITDAIGEGWITDLSQLNKLKPLIDDKSFRDQFRDAKRQAKLSLRTGSRRPQDRQSIRTQFSTARSSAFMNTSGNC